MMMKVDVSLETSCSSEDEHEIIAVSSEDESQEDCYGGEQQAMMVPLDEEDEDEEVAIPDIEAETAAAVAMVNQNRTTLKEKRRRRLFGRGRVRMGAVSWWTECKNIETSGCTFVLGYIALSFVLMTLMFNMREIVGDYCLGTKEEKREEYRENLEKAMELRRRSPFDADEENRFEKELAADLYYDGQGQTAGDMEYFQNHRVPIILREDQDEFDDPDAEHDEFEP